MSTKRTGRRIALATGLCVLVIGLAVIVSYREEIRTSYVLWKNFERVPDYERGYTDYRHRATGMLFLRLPGGKVFVPTYDPPKVEIGPFLIAKRKVSKADWENVLGQSPVWVKHDILGRRTKRVNPSEGGARCAQSVMNWPRD